MSNRWYLAVAVTATLAAMAWVNPLALPVWALIAVDLALLVAVAFTAHAELAARRPPPQHLTFFYIVVATGGALGGVLNGLVAPALFNAVWEFPLALLAAVLLASTHGRPAFRLLRNRYHPAFVLVLEAVVAFVLLLVFTILIPQAASWMPQIGVPLAWVGVAALLSLRPKPLLLGLAAVLAVPVMAGAGDMVLRDRSFYGSYTVRDADGWRILSHGTTVHGKQSLGAERNEPSTYYARSGPVGDAFRILDGTATVGAVGLGTGTIAAYGESGQEMTFFEIDPSVVEVASNADLFTYVSDSRAEIRHVVGDGRLELEEQPEDSYDALFLDAFSSDSIPVHLLTEEAFTSYGQVLRPGGLLMVHVSNRVFDLEPVVAAGADHLDWSAARGSGQADQTTGATDSVWIALSDDTALVDELLERHDWRQVGPARVRWTDDYSSVLTVLRPS